MAERVIVELLNGRGEVRARTRLDRFPAGIGRGYGNEVILDDPYACAEHLRIVREDDGTLVVEDLGSVNGTVPVGERDGMTRIVFRSGLQLRVGRTEIRFVDSSHPVAPAIRDPRGRSEAARAAAAPSVIERRLGAPKIALAVLVVSVAFFALNDWLGSYQRTTASKHLFSGLAVLVALAIWAGIWSVGSRITLQRFNYRPHLVWTAAIAVAATVLGAAGAWSSVAVPNAHLDDVLSWAIGLPLVIVWLAGHLALASTMAPRQRIKAAVLITVGVGALIAVNALSERHEFTTDLEYDSVIRPLPPSLVRAGSLEEFIAGTGRLQGQVDRLAEEADRRSAVR